MGSSGDLILWTPWQSQQTAVFGGILMLIIKQHHRRAVEIRRIRIKHLCGNIIFVHDLCIGMAVGTTLANAPCQGRRGRMDIVDAMTSIQVGTSISSQSRPRHARFQHIPQRLCCDIEHTSRDGGTRFIGYGRIIVHHDNPYKQPHLNYPLAKPHHALSALFQKRFVTIFTPDFA